MIFKCKGRIVQEDYIMGNIFHKKGEIFRDYKRRIKN